MLDAVNYSEARKKLASLMESVCDGSDAIVITRRKARPVVMLSLDEYRSIQETGYLLRSPANAARLLESVDDMRQGNVAPHPLAVLEND